MSACQALNLSVIHSLQIDTSKARATLVNGKLRVSIPKIAERRGTALSISVNG